MSNVIPAPMYVVFYTLLDFGLGPVSVGMLSDALTQSAGKEGLRYALAFLTVALATPMLFYAKALQPYLAVNR